MIRMIRMTWMGRIRKVIRGYSFRIREGVQFDVQTVWPSLAGVIPNDPSVAPPANSRDISVICSFLA